MNYQKKGKNEDMKKSIDEKNNWFKNRKGCRSWREGRYHPPKIQEEEKKEIEVEKLIMK